MIQSPFKDYYDYVANRYGGGDPRVVYVRNRISPQKKWWTGGALRESNLKVEMDGVFPFYSPRDLIAYDERETKCFAYLIVAGKAYLLMKQNGISDDNVNTFRVQPLNAIEEFDKRHSRRWWVRNNKAELGKEYPFLIELSRRIQAPVFVVRGVEGKWRSDKMEVGIAGQCPILREIGMPALVSAAQMYQDLAYFVGNTMKAHPDTEPPVEVSNREKILKAGFDLKKSFRHRV